jgi:hypothetical protein
LFDPPRESRDGKKEEGRNMITRTTMRTACAVSVTASSLVMAAGSAQSTDATPVQSDLVIATRATATAVDRTPVTPTFHIDAFLADDMLRPAMHPPIDQIPAMPMPNPDIDIPDSLGGPGNALYHDMETGVTTELVMPQVANISEKSNDGFIGADGIDSYADLYGPRGFGTMSALGDATIAAFPFRMNVKLVQEYVDAGNGNSSFFVCSGGMQDAEVILTAGHCVYKRDNDSTGNDFGFADRIWVYPGWDGNGLTLGNPDVLQNYGWAATGGLGAFTGWTVDGNFDWDLGLIRVNRAVGMLTGWYAWRSGGACDTLFYNNPSFPSEGCGVAGLHNGRDMYNWNGNFDSCPGNQMHINTTPGCFTALWGGQSGSNVYDIVGDNRYAHGVASNSNRTTSGNYAKMWTSFKDYMVDDFEPAARGAALDIQALEVRVTPTTITAGSSTSTATAQVPNPTNANPGSATYGFKMYLSTNNNISVSDTVLADRQYTYNYAAMQNVTLNTGNVTIPRNTPSGTYWVGMELDAGTDANNGNNDSDLWDATQITVNGVADIVANSCSAPNGTAYHGDSISVGYNVENEGGDPSNATTLTFYASTNTDISAGDTFLGSVNIGTFAGSQIKSGSANVTLPASLNGNYYIGYIASASDDAVVNQDNEAYDATTLNVQGRSDLFANYMTSLDSITGVGGQLDVRFNVRNNGTIASGAYPVDVYASINNFISVSDILLGTINRPSLGAGGSSTAVQSVGVPAFVAPGQYYIGMIVGPGTNENATGDNSAFDPDRVTFTDCPMDFDNNGLYDLTDITTFVSSFTAQRALADIDNNGLWDLADIVAFVEEFIQGCP